MITMEDVRSFALSLPGSTESPHFDMNSFRVNGKIYATVPPTGTHVHIFVSENETRAAAAEDGAAFELLFWGKRLAGVRVALFSADPDRVRELLHESWRMRAPKNLTSARPTP